ncbi:MAG: NUDIX hydrolase [Nanoarchaeota archaeon]|nr:NUDIX hydrolase [Nanoarchaeota archaeon]
MEKFVREWKGKKITVLWVKERRNDGPITQVSSICFTSKGKILIVRGADGKWHLPGGHPEENEELEQVVRREVWEEASVKLSKASLLGFSEIFFPGNPNKNEGKHYYQARFACLISGVKDVRVDPATRVLFERKFVSPEEFPKFVKWDDAKALMSLSLKEFKKWTINK